MVARPPVPTEPGSELAQLQGLLTLCLDLSKDVAQPDTEWIRELVQQIRTEFERQRGEQRKTPQQPTAGIEDLTEKIARGGASEEPTAKRTRPASAEISFDGGEGSEVRPTALRVAEASAALGILVGVPLSDLAEPHRTPRATGSAEASEETQPVELSSQPRHGAPSPSPVAELHAAEETTPVSVASALPRPSTAAEGIPSEAAV